GEVVPVGLFLDQRRTQRGVDFALDARALVVLHIDRTRQADEARVEGLRRLLVADVVFDLPQLFVHRLQRRLQRRDVLLRLRRLRPGRRQRLQLAAHIGQLAWIAHALGLDL